MTNEKRIENILKEHKAAIEAQIKKGFTSGLVLGHFSWKSTEKGVEIELLTK